MMAWVRRMAMVGVLGLLVTLLPVATGTAGAAAAAAAAEPLGGSIVHIKDDNVWLTSPDGAQKVQVTTDGATPSPDRKGSSRYNFPTQSDDGSVIVAGRDQFEGFSIRGYLWVMNRQGEVLTKFAPPQFEQFTDPSCGGFLQLPRGIISAEVSPDGRKIVYESYADLRRSNCTWTSHTRVDVINLDGTGHTAIRRASDGSTFRLGDPTWLTSSRLLVQSDAIDSGIKWVDLPDPAARDWTDIDAGRNSDLEADKLVGVGLFNMTMELWSASGGPPAGQPTHRGTIGGPDGIQFTSPSWARGGGGLAWTEHFGSLVGDEPEEGIFVEPVGDLVEFFKVPRNLGTLIVPGGIYPFWGPAPVTSAAPAATSTSLVREGDVLVATVTGPAPAVSGNVRFMVDGAAGPTVPLGAGGRATMPVSGLAPGNHSVVAQYLGSSTHAASTSPALVVTVPVAPAPGSRFTALAPVRILDTRTGNGAGAVPVGARGVLEVQVTGRGGVPADATAVVLNVTSVGLSGSPSSYLTAWPTGEARPNASNLNYVTGQVIPNLVTVKVGAGGRVSLYNDTGSVHVLADVAGYYATGAESAFNAVQPSRLLDTRTGTGAPAATIGPGGVVEVQVTGRGGVPAGAAGVVLNVTAVGLSGAPSSYITAWPTGTTAPVASNLNLVAGQVIPNLVVAKIGAGGRVSLRNDTGQVHLLADVAGYYATTGATFTPLAPTRLLDTRTGVGAPAVRIPAGGTVELQVTGRGGVAPAATAVVLNVTAVNLQGAAGSWLTAWPTGQPMPLASNLNMVAGQVIPNAVVAKIGANGKVTISNAAGTIDVLADVAGYYTS